MILPFLRFRPARVSRFPVADAAAAEVTRRTGPQRRGLRLLTSAATSGLKQASETGLIRRASRRWARLRFSARSALGFIARLRWDRAGPGPITVHSQRMGPQRVRPLMIHYRKHRHLLPTTARSFRRGTIRVKQGKRLPLLSGASAHRPQSPCCGFGVPALAGCV